MQQKSRKRWYQAESPYGRANSTGRLFFWYGFVCIVGGLWLLLSPVAPMAGVSVALGVWFMSMMAYDPRCKRLTHERGSCEGAAEPHSDEPEEES